MSDVLKDHLDVFYGCGIDNKNYKLVSNSQDQILNAIKGKNIKTISFPNDTFIHHQRNSICEG